MLVRLAAPVPWFKRDTEGAPVQWRADEAQRPEDGAKRPPVGTCASVMMTAPEPRNGKPVVPGTIFSLRSRPVSDYRRITGNAR